MGNLLKSSKGISACSGAEINLLQDGTISIRLIRLLLDKTLVEITEKKSYDITDGKFPKLPEEPLAITLSGRGVLTKKAHVSGESTEQSLQNLFPNIKIGDFYVQYFSSGEQLYVSIVRKEIADKIIASLRIQGASIVILSLGPFLVDHVIPQLNVYNTALSFDRHQVQFDQDLNWIEYHITDKATDGYDLKADSEVIPEKFLIAYATAFQLMLNEKLDLIKVESESLDAELKELLAKIRFKRNGSLILAGLFLSLLVNFLLFSFYNSKNRALESRVGQQSDVLANKAELLKEVAEKEELVRKLSWNKGMSYAFLCDQIGQTVPETITLNQLKIGLLNQEQTGLMKKDKAYQDGIRISGAAASVHSVNDWIYLLKDKEWVKEVKLQEYAEDRQKEVQVFTILIKY